MEPSRNQNQIHDPMGMDRVYGYNHPATFLRVPRVIQLTNAKTYISTKEETPTPRTRISASHAFSRRPQGTCQAPCTWPEEPHGLRAITFRLPGISSDRTTQ